MKTDKKNKPKQKRNGEIVKKNIYISLEEKKQKIIGKSLSPPVPKAYM